MNVVLAANPRRKRRRKPKQKTKKRAGHKRPTQKRPVQAKKKRRTAKRRKKTTAARKRPARKTEKRTMARKRRKSGSRRKRSGGKRRMTKKQRAAALRNLAKGRRARARKSSSSSPRRRRRTRRRRNPGGTHLAKPARRSRKKRHTNWKRIKPYRRRAKVGGHKRRVNPGALMTAGLAAVGVGAGVLASKAADKFLPATLSPQLKSWIKAGAALAGGVGGAMLSPALGIGFGASLGGKALDEVSEQIMSPSQVTGLGRIYQQLPSHDTQLEAIVPEGTSFGAVFDSSVDLDELAFEEAG